MCHACCSGDALGLGSLKGANALESQRHTNFEPKQKAIRLKIGVNLLQLRRGALSAIYRALRALALVDKRLIHRCNYDILCLLRATLEAQG